MAGLQLGADRHAGLRGGGEGDDEDSGKAEVAGGEEGEDGVRDRAVAVRALLAVVQRGGNCVA